MGSHGFISTYHPLLNDCKECERLDLDDFDLLIKKVEQPGKEPGHSFVKK